MSFERLNDSEFEKLKATSHPEQVYELELTDEEIDGTEVVHYLYVTKATKGAMNILTNAVVDQTNIAMAVEQVVLSAVKSPDKASVATLLNNKKQYVNKILEQLNRLEGSKGSAVIKKITEVAIPLLLQYNEATRTSGSIKELFIKEDGDFHILAGIIEDVLFDEDKKNLNSKIVSHMIVEVYMKITNFSL